MVYIKLIKHGGEQERILECKHFERFLRTPEMLPAVREDAIEAWRRGRLAHSPGRDHPFAKFTDYYPEELWLMDGTDPKGFTQVLLRGCSVYVMSDTGDTIDSWDVPVPKEELGSITPSGPEATGTS